MDFEELKDPDLQERAKGCKTPEEFLALVQEQGVDLSSEELKAISGGDSGWTWSMDDDCDDYDCRRLGGGAL